MNLGLLSLGHNVYSLDLDATAVEVTSILLNVFEAVLGGFDWWRYMVIHRKGWRRFRAHFVMYVYIYGLVPSCWKCVIKLSCIFLVTLSTSSLSCSRKYKDRSPTIF